MKLASLLQIIPKALAAHSCPTEPCLPNPLTSTSILFVLDKVFNFLFDIAIVIAPIVITIAGFQMLFAAGNTEKIGKARKTITYAVIGLIIVVIGKGLILLLFSLLTVQE
jgi:hypothetical protein